MADVAMDEEWIPVPLLHVLHRKGDSFGKFLANITHAPYIVVAILIVLIAFRRELATVTLFIGQIGNELVNFFLKRYLKHPRPPRAPITTYGMPSNHCQFMFFFAVYVLLFLTYRYRGSALSKFCVSALLVVTVALVWYSRVYLHFHTWEQTIVGSILGSIIGVLWFAFTSKFLYPRFSKIEDWSICRWFRLRDSSQIDDVLEMEYQASRKYRKKRD